MKKLALILCLITGPALADESKPPVWVLAIQFKATTMSTTYATQAACEASAKVTNHHMKKLGIGRADCIPVVQP